VEQSATPWRVFDAPTPNDPNGGGPGSNGTASPGPGTAATGNQHLAIAAVIGAAALGLLAIVLAVSGAGGSIIDGPQPSGHETSGLAEANAGEIVIDVSGAVVTPGLYHLNIGARVGDAIDAAGGFSPRVDVDRVGRELNLAATLADGAQVRVPSRDDPGVGSGPGASTGDAAGSQLVNLNTATEAELDALSGIGPVTAGKIIESRATAPFKTVDELRERGLVGEKTFEKIRAQLTVG
jgi:competence protein ComEA